MFQLGYGTDFEYMSWYAKTFWLSAVDGKVARFRFVTNTAPVSWTILVAVSGFLAVAANIIVV
jgi:hypothetical protein